MRRMKHVLKMAAVIPFAISDNSQYSIYSSPDGVLKLWEADNGVLKQEYTPSAHLSATCTCLSWGPKRNLDVPGRKKRRKSGGSAITEQYDLIAVGTTAGSILIYSIVKGDVKTIMEEGHADTVSDVCWHPENNTLFSCSCDRHIIHWDVISGKVKHKWKGDSGSIHSICLCAQNHLLSSGRSIKLWDLETYSVLKKFTGHATEVFRLLPILSSPTELPETPEGAYFLSAALNDRLVNVWHINTSVKDKSSIASFSLPEEPVMLDLRKEQEEVILAAVTKSGQVNVFVHTMNGKVKKPLKPKVTIQIASSGGNDSIPKPIQILASQLCEDQRLLLVYGNYLKPVFEKLVLDMSSSDVCLIREEPVLSSVKHQAEVSKLKMPGVSNDVTILAPENTVASGPSLKEKRKRKPSVSDMNMEERLNAISINKPETSKEPPKADTLVRLLTQGLQSEDKNILKVCILSVYLSCEYIYIINRIFLYAPTNFSARHNTFILTLNGTFWCMFQFPDMVDNLSVLYQSMDSRTKLVDRLSKLKGKLELMLSQIANQAQQGEEDVVPDQRPLLMYQEESSDDDIAVDNLMPDRSDTEDFDDLFLSDTEAATDQAQVNGTEEDEEDMESD
ncbi:WD repeat-containing protein 43-like [Ostrea edulis]|uniref:WD repeat-containing protein 43-like n=1 Tax=Ostrea edulis TaxID=37623 RepID=UPI0024AF0822|nr:WD repeat-containing protein 43-like [Ostrea edulis]